MPASGLLADISSGLISSPRELPSRYLYDALGSALFDAICELPWYPVTRAETELLANHGAEILAAAGTLGALIELGPGNGSKLDTLLSHRTERLDVRLIDLSASALALASQRLVRNPVLTVQSCVAEYRDGLAHQLADTTNAGPRLVLLLGSNIGNFAASEAAEFLRAVRALLSPHDMLLLGTDLIKPLDEMILAYDDPLGVTAAFNRNILVRLNRDAGTDFNVSAYRHEARWNSDASEMEMWLVADSAQRVRVPGHDDVLFKTDEGIRTERSCKYRREDAAAMLVAAGFTVVQQWDVAGFCETLARRGKS